MRNESIDFTRFIINSREILLNPKEAFPALPLKGGFGEPVLKAAIYGTIGGLFSLLWTMMGLSPLGGTLWSEFSAASTIIYSILGAVFAVFIGGAFLLIFSVICKGNTDYEANVRVAAALMVTYPINSFMAFLYGINSSLGSVVGLAITFYSIYLIYLAGTLALKGKEASVKIVAIVLILFSMFTFFAGRKATQAIDEFPNEFQQELVD